MYWQRSVGKEEFYIRKTILFTHEFTPFRGGVATYCAEVVAAAERTGLPLLVFTAGRPAPEEGRSVTRLGGQMSLQFWFILWLGWRIWQQRQVWRGQRIVLASIGMHWIFAIYSSLGLAGKETIMVPLFHGSEIGRAEGNFFWRMLMRHWLSQCDLILAASEFTRERLSVSSLLPPGLSIHLALCAVKESLRIQAENEVANLSRPTKCILLTLARLHPRKGQLDTLQALALLPLAVRERLIYRIAGTGSAHYLQQLKDAAQKVGIAVEFLGEVEESALAEVYRGCDIYVMSSRSLPHSVEGFGMTYLEAGLFAKAVVGYRTGGVDAAVCHGVTGLLVEEGNITNLAAALHRLIENPELRKELGAAGRAHALSFSWTQTAQTIAGNG
jgi:phosphatidyl-myo-inositol dimannoside synthase